MLPTEVPIGAPKQVDYSDDSSAWAPQRAPKPGTNKGGVHLVTPPIFMRLATTLTLYESNLGHTEELVNVY